MDQTPNKKSPLSQQDAAAIEKQVRERQLAEQKATEKAETAQLDQPPGQQPTEEEIPELPAVFKPFGLLIDYFLGRLSVGEADRPENFSEDANVAIIQQEPLRARLLIRIASIAILMAIIWAYFAELEEVTRGQGKVIPSGQIQILDSLDGGIVTEILVKEGDTVEKGQLLVQIDPTRFTASLGENEAKYLSLLAKEARLKAQVNKSALSLPNKVLEGAPDIARQERNFYYDKKRDIDNQVELVRQQLAQKQQELIEATSRRDQAALIYSSTQQELTATRPLVTTGAVSKIEVLRLERETNRARGDRDQASAQIARAQSTIAEAKRRVSTVQNAATVEARKELQEVSAQLKTLIQTGKKAEDQVKQSAIRSQVKGTIKRMLVTTVGGVVSPGKPVVEIVPFEDAMVVEARIQPKDIAFLHPGQRGTVKITAYDFSIYGGLEGALTYISPDTVVDEKGNPFYMIRMQTDKSNLGENLPISPGMIVEINIQTGKKSVLNYILKPLIKAKSVGLTER